MNEKNCYTGTSIEQIENECGGNFISTSCVQTPNAISYLDLPAGSTQTEINAAITTSLIFKDQQIAEFSSTVIEAGDNIEVTGVGSEENPYVISSTGGAQDLQSVLDTGGYAEVDGGNSYVTFFEDDGSGNLFTEFTVSDGTDFGTISIDKDGIRLSNSSGTKESNIHTINGDLSISVDDISGRTEINFETPISNSNILIPAKSISGTYTLATLDDIYKIPNLQIYPDNASAISGGLTTDEIYKTATGELRIVI